MIRLEDITKTYGGTKEVHALNGVSLQIQAGEIYGIIGKSGVEKVR